MTPATAAVLSARQVPEARPRAFEGSAWIVSARKAPSGWACSIGCTGSNVYRYLLVKTRHRETAEDLTHEVFASLARTGIDRRPEGDGERPWLLAVARRRYIDHLRANAGEGLTASRLCSAAGEPIAPEVPVGAGRAIRDALTNLGESQKQLVRLRLFEDRPFSDVATALGMSEGACKMRLGRALERVQTALRRSGHI